MIASAVFGGPLTCRCAPDPAVELVFGDCLAGAVFAAGCRVCYDKTRSAVLALGKGAFAIHQSGRWYTDENIDQMLMERHLNKKARRASHKNHMKGPKKRTEEDDERFRQSFEKMVQKAVLTQGDDNHE